MAKWSEKNIDWGKLMSASIRDALLSRNNIKMVAYDPGQYILSSSTPVDNKLYYVTALSSNEYVTPSDVSSRDFTFHNPDELYFVLKRPQRVILSKSDYPYKGENSLYASNDALVANDNDVEIWSSPLFYTSYSTSLFLEHGALAFRKDSHEILEGLVKPLSEFLSSAVLSNGKSVTAQKTIQCPYSRIWGIGRIQRLGSLPLSTPPVQFESNIYYSIPPMMGCGYFDSDRTFQECYYSAVSKGVYVVSGCDTSRVAVTDLDPHLLASLYPNVLYVDTYQELEELLGKSNEELDEIAINYDPDSPYTPGSGGGKPSSTGGGGGSFNSDPGPAQIIPTGTAGADAASTGMFNLYVPTLSELQNFGGWLWSENFNIDSFKRLFTDPVSSILSFSRAPFSLDAVMATAAAEIHFANLSSGISSARLTRSNGQVDWGSVNIVEYWGGAMDYAPYTKICLYLPWGTGFVDLKISDVMKGSIVVKTNIDALSGDCVHLIIDGHGRVIGQHSGNVYQDVPFSGGGGFLRAVGSGLMSGAVAGIMTGGAGAIASVGLETARSVAGADYSPSRGGGTGAAGALMGVQYPYIIIDRPIQSIPASFGSNRGYPSNITSKLSMITGYTEIKAVHLENIPATDAELSEIESLLKSGVIL